VTRLRRFASDGKKLDLDLQYYAPSVPEGNVARSRL
jgi:hypothetical protein